MISAFPTSAWEAAYVLTGLTRHGPIGQGLIHTVRNRMHDLCMSSSKCSVWHSIAVRLNKSNMTDAKCLRQFVWRDDRRIFATAFKITQKLVLKPVFSVSRRLRLQAQLLTDPRHQCWRYKRIVPMNLRRFDQCPHGAPIPPATSLLLGGALSNSARAPLEFPCIRENRLVEYASTEYSHHPS